MAVLALPESWKRLAGSIRLPPLPKRVPRFNTPAYRIFSAIWIAAFVLALVGPAAGLYQRYSEPAANSQLLLGSHAGIAVDEQDATRIRFPVGPHARAAGIRPGDDIVAIYGLPMDDVVPVTEQLLEARSEDPSYIVMSNLLFGTDSTEVPMSLRAPSGEVREVLITTGEQHIEAAAREWGLTPAALNFVDLPHILFYPFLLWAAWILHRRNSRDAVSSILSLAVLLTIAAEQPSTIFLAAQGVPRQLNVALYDLGNIALLAGILLFPHGDLSPRRLLILAALPVLMLLQGDLYRSVLLGFMILAVLILVRCLRKTPEGDVRQQIKWALFGFTGYAVFRGLSLLGDMLKTAADSFELQFLVEIGAGLSLGIATLLLQLGLLVALLRFRLYDAESIISRTASIAIVTLLVGASAAAVMEGIITYMQSAYEGSQTAAAMIGAVLATVLIGPLHSKVQQWAERRFHKSLMELREGLPEAMRDIRDVADLDSFVAEVLGRVSDGLHTDRAAFVLGREVKGTLGVSQAEALRWLLAFQPPETDKRIHCDADDKLFPLRLRVEDGSGAFLGWLLVGPRPDGSIAGSDEREALEEDIAVPLARSLRIVLNREAEKQELLQLLEAHRQRIERIERALQG
jgi:hypothetical protein